MASNRYSCSCHIKRIILILGAIVTLLAIVYGSLCYIVSLIIVHNQPDEDKIKFPDHDIGDDKDGGPSATTVCTVPAISMFASGLFVSLLVMCLYRDSRFLTTRESTTSTLSTDTGGHSWSAHFFRRRITDSTSSTPSIETIESGATRYGYQRRPSALPPPAATGGAAAAVARTFRRRDASFASVSLCTQSSIITESSEPSSPDIQTQSNRSLTPTMNQEQGIATGVCGSVATIRVTHHQSPPVSRENSSGGITFSGHI